MKKKQNKTEVCVKDSEKICEEKTDVENGEEMPDKMPSDKKPDIKSDESRMIKIVYS